MAKRDQLTFHRQSLKRLALPMSSVTFDVLEHSRLEYEKTTVDPSLADLRFFRKFGNSVSFKAQPAEACRWSNYGHGGKFVM